MSLASACFCDAAWDEATIHEFLSQDPSKSTPPKPSKSSALNSHQHNDVESLSNSTDTSDNTVHPPKHAHKRSHRKVSLKEKTLKATVQPSLSMKKSDIDQRATIATLENVIETEEKKQDLTENIGKKTAYGAYSLQQKKEILSQLHGRVRIIEESIEAAKNALEKLSQFM